MGVACLSGAGCLIAYGLGDDLSPGKQTFHELGQPRVSPEKIQRIRDTFRKIPPRKSANGHVSRQISLFWRTGGGRRRKLRVCRARAD